MKNSPLPLKRGMDLFIQNVITRNNSKLKVYTLKQRHKDNPFWISGDRHLCPKCRSNTHVHDHDQSCRMCHVKFIWL